MDGTHKGICAVSCPGEIDIRLPHDQRMICFILDTNPSIRVICRTPYEHDDHTILRCVGDFHLHVKHITAVPFERREKHRQTPDLVDVHARETPLTRTQTNVHSSTHGIVMLVPSLARKRRNFDNALPFSILTHIDRLVYTIHDTEAWDDTDELGAAEKTRHGGNHIGQEILALVIARAAHIEGILGAWNDLGVIQRQFFAPVLPGLHSYSEGAVVRKNHTHAIAALCPVASSFHNCRGIFVENDLGK